MTNTGLEFSITRAIHDAAEKADEHGTPATLRETVIEAITSATLGFAKDIFRGHLDFSLTPDRGYLYLRYLFTADLRPEEQAYWEGQSSMRVPNDCIYLGFGNDSMAEDIGRTTTYRACMWGFIAGGVIFGGIHVAS
jgi:hypothetical protein